MPLHLFEARMLNEQIEQDLSSLLNGRAGAIPSAPLRRLTATGDRSAPGPQSPDLSTVGAPAGPEDTPAAERDSLLAERQTTHGNFEDNALISQAIKDLLRSGPGWLRLSAIEREAMDMIALKFSRILSGKSMSKQHWEDVRGYAALVEEKCF